VSHRHTAFSVAVLAFGAATVCMLPILGNLVSPTHFTVFHLVGPASALFVPAIFNQLLLTFVLTLLLLIAKPVHRFGVLVWSGFFFFLPWIALKSVAILYALHLPHKVSFSVFLLCCFATLLSTLLWRPDRARVYHRACFFADKLLGLVAIFGLILTIQTSWFGWMARHLNDPATHAASSFGVVAGTPQPTGASAAHPRILWIIFDELSQDQVYDSRFPGLQLPNLDQFASQAVVFDHVSPAAIYTEIAIPSLMSDTHGNAIRTSGDGSRAEFRTSPPDQHPGVWRPFDPQHTVFADAQSLGYRSAIVGWFNPYCRLLSSVLSSCYWTNQSALSAMFPARTIRQNLFHPALRLFLDIPAFFFPNNPRFTGRDDDVHFHIDDYQSLAMAADTTLADPTLDFVFLHLPIPHPNGIYDRRRGVLTTGPSTYIDNLALVDKYLGHLHQLLEQQGHWDDTTILIMGDHSWRTQLLWMASGWSQEEQRASHNGGYDDRPFYALKLAGETTPAHITQPYKATNTQPLIDALLRHQIATPQQLAQWAQATR
jgi:hypothetical protein